MKRNSAKTKLRENGFLLGPFVEVGAPELIEILGLAGFDFAIIDCEHASFSGETVGNMIRAAATSEIAPLVRVRENVPGAILEALDLGATGLHIPQIATADDARRAVRAAKFPPEGERGFNPFVRASGYGTEPIEEFRKTANDDTLLVLHIEAQDSLERLDEILSIPGIDVAFLGPYDMSQTLGLPGQITHPRVRETMRAIVHAARPRGVAVGCFANTLEHAEVWLGEGVQYLSYSVDSLLFREACQEVRRGVDQLRKSSGANRRRSR